MNEKLELLINEVKKAVLGKDDVLKKVVIALLANGHILLEDIPGVGKTNLAVALTKAIQLDYQRVQLTSDVLPSDLLGYSVYDFETKEMTFKKDRYLQISFWLMKLIGRQVKHNQHYCRLWKKE